MVEFESQSLTMNFMNMKVCRTRIWYVKKVEGRTNEDLNSDG